MSLLCVCEVGAVSQQRMRATATGAAQHWVMVVMVAEDTD